MGVNIGNLATILQALVCGTPGERGCLHNSAEQENEVGNLLTTRVSSLKIRIE